jgi:TATA-box binding protein (TBP) (component of TFIID and TFIIIB)
MGLGTKTVEAAISEMEIVAKVLGYSFKTEPSISNMVSVGNFHCQIDMDIAISVFEENRIQAIYEPEQFPGLIVYLEISETRKITPLIFASGKIVLPGLRNLNEIESALMQVNKILRKALHQ